MINYTNTTADALLNDIVNATYSELMNDKEFIRDIFDSDYYLLKEQPEQCDPINVEAVPNEILIAIFAFNDPIDHYSIRRVCREWRKLPLLGYLNANGRTTANTAANGYITANAATKGYITNDSDNAEKIKVQLFSDKPLMYPYKNTQRIIYRMGASFLMKEVDKMRLILQTSDSESAKTNLIEYYEITKENGELNKVAQDKFYHSPTEQYIIKYYHGGFMEHFINFKNGIRKSVFWGYGYKIESVSFNSMKKFEPSMNYVTRADISESLYISDDLIGKFEITHTIGNVRTKSFIKY